MSDWYDTCAGPSEKERMWRWKPQACFRDNMSLPSLLVVSSRARKVRFIIVMINTLRSSTTLSLWSWLHFCPQGFCCGWSTSARGETDQVEKEIVFIFSGSNNDDVGAWTLDRIWSVQNSRQTIIIFPGTVMRAPAWRSWPRCWSSRRRWCWWWQWWLWWWWYQWKIE